MGKFSCAFTPIKTKSSPKSRTPARASRRKSPTNYFSRLPRTENPTAPVWDFPSAKKPSKTTAVKFGRALNPATAPFFASRCRWRNNFVARANSIRHSSSGIQNSDVNRIKLLSEQVANQIAAGEVIERPASVVKELVENSLDADAKKISVEIGAGGRSLIRVTDDGFGMSRDDALLCLERHATSKIQRAEDLSSIATLGFRGEALPSIASVSKFVLTTRERFGVPPSGGSEAPSRVNAELQTIEGTQIIIAGGKISEVKAAGSATGTSIEVRQLFFNLPARRKFLRTEETEAAHIQHYLTLAALAFPEVAFTFVKDGRNVWQLAAQKSDATISSRLDALRERFRALLGDEKLLPVNFSASLQDNSPHEETEISFETALPEKSKI